MLDPRNLVTRAGGIARGRDIQRYGLTRWDLSHAVKRGDLLRLRNGVFAVPGMSPTVLAAATHGGMLTCGPALRLHGVWTLDADGVHVWLGENGRVHPHPGCACIGHFASGPTRFGVASVEQALLHLFSCAGEEAFFSSFESAWRGRKLSRAARHRIRSALPQSARWLIDLARPDADSGLESLLRLRLHQMGITLDCQVAISGVGVVDFVVAGRLILETDGKENHEGRTNRSKDLRRDAAASALGYETLRFDYAQVVYDWSTVAAAIRGALARLRDYA